MKITGRISIFSIVLAAALVCATTASANTTTGVYSGDLLNFTRVGSTNTFNFNIVLNGGEAVSGVLTFTTTPLNGDNYGITGVSGTVYAPHGEVINVNDSSLMYDLGGTGTCGSPSAYCLANFQLIQYDNILNLSGTGTIFDQYGLYFPVTGSEDTDDINFYYSQNSGYFADVHINDAGTAYEVDDGEDHGNGSPVPEPSTWLLLGSGLFGLAGLALKSRRLGLRA